MSSVLSFRRGFSWTFAANVVYAICQWAMLIVLARFGSPADVGEFALALAVTAPVFLLANMSLRTVQASDARAEFRLAEYLGLRLVTSVAAFAIVGSIALLGFTSSAGTILAVAGSRVVMGAMDIYHGQFQRHRAMDIMSRSVILNGALSLGAMAMAFASTGSVAIASVAMAFASLVVLVGYDLPMARRLSISLSLDDEPSHESLRSVLESWGRLAWVALPLGLSAGLISLAANLPRYAIEAAFGGAQLGIFAAMAYFMVASNTVVSALADRFAAGELPEFRAMLRRLVVAGALLGILGVLIAAVAGPLILTVFYGPEYAEPHDAFVWLSVATAIGFVGWFLDASIAAARRFSLHLATTIGLLIAAAIATAVLVPEHGLIGAAWALAIASAVHLALRLVAIARVIATASGSQPVIRAPAR